ncbi:hypothetical protein [Nitrosomonas sp. Nm166]|uniref:hypothetical protein n=1 Tax=Nitrosomonas sp. Nm166 TaxID=1881054 RepID=UPI0008E4B8C0|nr:hypothetical protein [Nitrosomonas sp. Nm166]SFF28115.1 hypothetical protein SAMN05428977_11032 [Nitrosomonas sp. Nm166]
MKLLLGIIILILLALSARFRKFAGFFVLICVVGGFLFWQYQEYEKKQSKSRISPSELVLKNVSFKSTNNSYEMTGRLINNSEKYTLNGIQLKISVKDCANNDNANCITFSERNEYIYISIPPKQARDFKKDIYLYSDQIVENKLIWNYSIEYTESE